MPHILEQTDKHLAHSELIKFQNPSRMQLVDGQDYSYEGLSCAVVHPAHNRMKAAHWISLNLRENIA